jgi:tripartite-type tricarboxylate transporter receptor subunit TctC
MKAMAQKAARAAAACFSRAFIWASVSAAVCAAAPALAQDFYKGKTVVVLIPSSASGGYDSYARLLARHMGQYLPGRADMVPQNMPGAGGKVAISYLANVAPKDGTVIAGAYPQTLTEAAIGRRDLVKFDTKALTYIGSMNGEPYYCFVRTDAPVKTMKDLFSHELLVGATGQGSSTSMSPALLNNLLGTKFKIISGYTGSAQVVLAVLRNEVQGWCGMGWSSIHGGAEDALRRGELKVLFQENGEQNERVTAMKLERATDVAKTDEDRRIMELIYSQQLYGRPFLAPPNIPAQRTAELRKAFDAALADEKLKVEAARLNMELRPIPGPKLQAIIEDLYSTPEATLARARNALEPGAATKEMPGAKPAGAD